MESIYRMFARLGTTGFFVSRTGWRMQWLVHE